MKKHLILSIISLILLIFAIIKYINADKEMYYYAKNNLPIYHNKLPFGSKPEYWDHRLDNSGFKIMDKYDFVHIGDHVRYCGYPDILVDSVISYGFNDTLLVAIIADSSKNLYCFIQNDTLIRSITLILLTNCNIEKLKHDYNLKWIENPNKPPENISSTRFFSGILFYFSLIFFIIYFRKYLKEKHKEKKNEIH